MSPPMIDAVAAAPTPTPQPAPAPADDARAQVVHTRVARAIAGEHMFFGYRVGGELAGNESFWSLFSLAIGHRRLSADESGLLDDLNGAQMCGDPRIQPLKLARMVASRGGAVAGCAAGLLMVERSMIGPGCLEHGARLLATVEAALDGAEPSDGAVAAALERTTYATARQLPGFGVPFRDRDERLPALRRCLHARGRDGLRFVQVHDAVVRVIQARRRLTGNASLTAAAMLLDLGFAPAQCGLVGVALGVTYFLANSLEGAAQQHPALQTMPAQWTRYVGPPPRETRRARAARDAATTGHDDHGGAR